MFNSRINFFLIFFNANITAGRILAQRTNCLIFLIDFIAGLFVDWSSVCATSVWFVCVPTHTYQYICTYINMCVPCNWISALCVFWSLFADLCLFVCLFAFVIALIGITADPAEWMSTANRIKFMQDQMKWNWKRCLKHELVAMLGD